MIYIMNNIIYSTVLITLIATYPISVFTKDVLQLKVSMGNACRKARCYHNKILDFVKIAARMFSYL